MPLTVLRIFEIFMTFLGFDNVPYFLVSSQIFHIHSKVIVQLNLVLACKSDDLVGI